MIIGYARVSSKEQNLNRQIKELEEFGCEKIFTEKESAKNFERPIYQELKSKMRFGDMIVVQDLSRFGRNKEGIMEEWKWFIDNEIDITVLNMPILNTRNYADLEGIGKLVSDIVLTLFSWMVEEERTRIKTAQREGIEIAKKQGVYKGRPVKYSKESKGADKLIFDHIIEQLNLGVSVMNIHKATGLSRSTIYKIKNDYEAIAASTSDN